MTPPMIVATIVAPITKHRIIESVKGTVCGAAPLDKGPQMRFQALMSEGGHFTQVYSMTEATCVLTRIKCPETDVTGSVGRPILNMDMKIVEDNDADITRYNITGEICVGGPTVILGYFNSTIGDQASSKLWYIVDRKKELIEVRAWQVAPPKLGAVLLSHLRIVDAAVIGVQFSRDKGQVPRAYDVRRLGSDGGLLNEEEVKTFMEGKLALYKRRGWTEE